MLRTEYTSTQSRLDECDNIELRESKNNKINGSQCDYLRSNFVQTWTSKTPSEKYLFDDNIVQIKFILRLHFTSRRHDFCLEYRDSDNDIHCE